MEIGAWNLPLTSVLSPCPRGEAERPGRLQRSRVDAQTVEPGGERADMNGPTVRLIPACRSVMLVTQTAARLPSDQNLPLERWECELFLLLPANFLGAPTRNAEVQTVGGSLVRRRLTFLIALPKNFFAALVERVAATILHAFEQCLH